MNTPLPSNQEWAEAGFVVPPELCSKPAPMVEQSPLTQVKHEAKPLTGSPQMPNGSNASLGSASGGLFQPSPAIEDPRALIAELRVIQAHLEANLRAMALVKLTNLIRRIDRESEQP
ncbi:MAG: hypothetical protein V4563_15935 [Pseudomonadota bacterium]